MLRGMDGRPNIREAVDALPLGALRSALAEQEAWVVGGFVRDLLRQPGQTPDIDIAIASELEPILARIGSEDGVEVEASHLRFGTARVVVEGLIVDLSRTRAETYARPGALPDVEPAGIEPDLARRDFTVNAMAVLLPTGTLLDPFGGAQDLETGTLRVLHERSFLDDPTRAIRAARYASRLGLEPDPGTLRLLRATDLGTVSDDRRSAELSRLADEPSAPAGFRLLDEWGLLDARPETLELIGAADRTAGESPWAGDPGLRRPAILLVAAAGEGLQRALALAAAEPERPSEAVRISTGHAPEELLVAAAAGSSWPADYVERWRSVRLSIDGNDLIAAGIPSGPAVGAGLQGALERKLDGGLEGGREAELELAIELARRVI